MKETTTWEAQATESDQRCSVRPEARAREFVHVARVNLLRVYSQGNRIDRNTARCEGRHVKCVVSHAHQTRSLEIHPWGG